MVIKNIPATLKPFFKHPDATWIYRQMTPANKKTLDNWLVKIKHPLAYQPGSNEDRFKAIHKEITKKWKK